VRGAGAGGILVRVLSMALWAVLIFLPLAVLLIAAIRPGIETEGTEELWPLALRSFGLAAIVAAAAVVLGWTPGRLLGTSRWGRDLLLMLLLMPLVLPRYVLYYGWSLLLTPTSGLGRYLSARPEAAKFVWTAVSSSVLVLWYWPLAALLISQGWRNFDRRIRDSALLDTHGFEMFRHITLPMLGRSLVLAFGVCFVLAASEFGTFDLAGVRAIGPELAVLYQLTGSEGAVARAAWPVVVVALAAAIWFGRNCRGWGSTEAAVDTVEFKSQRWRWGGLFGLIAICLLGPLGLFLANIRDSMELRRFMTLHLDELGWSLAVSGLAAVGAYVIALGSLSLDSRGGWVRRFLGFTVRTTIFLAMFVPASVVAVSLLRLLAAGNLPDSVRQGWFIVSAGQAARFAGVALVMLLLGRGPEERRLQEMARLDGASSFQAWWHVQLPRTWPLVAGTLILLVMLGVTELSATMVLLPPGLPNFAQRLLNQMHYARDQQVIASCLVLICVFALLSGLVVLMLRAPWGRAVRLSGRAAILILCATALGLGGCDGRSGGSEAKVVNAFGRSGRGAGEFIYPRAIDIAADRSLVVIDKTGRIQRLDAKGRYLGMMNMPQIDSGKPTGLTFHPNGNLYVADTHYHRILVFSPEGEIVQQFGKFGEEDGCFIYPTDIVFSESGEIYVSEYGGNDRISVFSENGVFLRSFGSPGSGDGQFARPSAMCIDRKRKRLYIADACNHRIAVYGLDGRPPRQGPLGPGDKLIDYIGSIGRRAGQLRYPYDLAMLGDGTLVVCEFGNNRIQLFSPDGRSLAVYGEAGPELGQLAYPWGVAVDKAGRAFIVDAGNNRIQVWQL
jgi:ABC-type Fe3+ transport system permease subunit/DNA-binding beta-propeller fold protein YncE